MRTLMTIEPWIIDEIEKDRKRREQPAQVPLYIDVPQQIPPGWEPDPDCPGGYRRTPDRDRDSGDRGVTIIQM